MRLGFWELNEHLSGVKAPQKIPACLIVSIITSHCVFICSCLFTVTAWEKDTLSFPKQQQIYHDKYLPFTFRALGVSLCWYCWLSELHLIRGNTSSRVSPEAEESPSPKSFAWSPVAVMIKLFLIVTAIWFCTLCGQQFSKWSTRIQSSSWLGCGPSGAVWETLLNDEMRFICTEKEFFMSERWRTWEMWALVKSRITVRCTG